MKITVTKVNLFHWDLSLWVHTHKSLKQVFFLFMNNRINLYFLNMSLSAYVYSPACPARFGECLCLWKFRACHNPQWYISSFIQKWEILLFWRMTKKASKRGYFLFKGIANIPWPGVLCLCSYDPCFWVSSSIDSKILKHPNVPLKVFINISRCKKRCDCNKNILHNINEGTITKFKGYLIYLQLKNNLTRHRLQGKMSQKWFAVSLMEHEKNF